MVNETLETLYKIRQDMVDSEIKNYHSLHNIITKYIAAEQKKPTNINDYKIGLGLSYANETIDLSEGMG